MIRNTELKWWQKAVFYQIYPRSFADGNGDGIGDFTGMIEKLDYLQLLGIDAVWLSPHYPSPYIDCGYDISNYCDVAREYGNLGQFKIFLDGLHSRGMRLVLDLVLNHTSDRHPWFIESRSSRDNPKRDWYMWKEGKDGKPPMNWYSAFGGSAWEFDPVTGEYYYHYFFKEQPDLNWNNPQVQKAMFDAARFWLDLGVDGFRLDAVGTIFEDESYPQLSLGFGQEELFRKFRLAQSSDDVDEAMDFWIEMFRHQVDQPRVHQVTRDLRKLINEYQDRVLIGETEDISFYGQNDDELHLNFNFPLMQVKRLTAQHARENQRQRLSALPPGAWPCNTLGNHDTPRIFSNFGDGQNNEAQSRLYLMMLLTLKGTPFLYNGEEIGMSDLLMTEKSKFRDPLCLFYYDLEKRAMGSSEEKSLLVGAEYGRDKNRTPMQWSNAVNAGFCPEDVEPWLPVNPDYSRGINVEQQSNDQLSILNFYRKMIKIRAVNSALSGGDYKEIDLGNPEILSYLRHDNQQRLLVILNMSDSEQMVDTGEYQGWTLFLSTREGEFIRKKHLIVLDKYQGCILSPL